MHGPELAYQVCIFAFILMLMVVCLFPLLYVVCVSLTSEAEWIERGKLMLIPYKPTLGAYEKIFTINASLVGSLGISALRTVIGTTLSLSCTLIMGYAVSRRDMPGGKALMFLILFTILFSGGMIPTFLVVKDTGMYDSFWSMVVPSMINGWNILVCRQFFQNLPYDIEEAAQIDGVTKIGMFIRIILPMSLAVIASLGLFTSVNHWNAWFDAMIYIKTESIKPLQLILYQMHKDANLSAAGNDFTSLTDAMERSSTRSLRMALTVLGTVPILCVYPFLQKYFVKGVYTGAVKG